jgi:ABC-type multidrug transport system fused ATPase/permease subunit
VPRHLRNGLRRRGQPGGQLPLSRDARQWLVRTNRAVNKDILLEEYKTIRAEVTASISAQISILAFGAATIGFSFAAASQTSNENFRDMFLLVLVPLLCYLIVIVWFAEVMRMLRAGAFIMRLEKRLDEQFGHGALTWESTIFQSRCRSGPSAFLQDPDKFRTFAIWLLFFTIAATSIVIGWGSVSVFAWQHFFAVIAFVIAFAVVLRIFLLREEEVSQLARPWLREGDEGDDVIAVHENLRDAGFYKGPVERTFNRSTRAAVERLQEEHGLEVDGTVGLMTMYLLEDLAYRAQVLAAARTRRRLLPSKRGQRSVVKGDAVAPERPARSK